MCVCTCVHGTGTAVDVVVCVLLCTCVLTLLLRTAAYLGCVSYFCPSASVTRYPISTGMLGY